MVREWSEKDGCKFKNNREETMNGNYCPEIDISDELGDEVATQYQQMIGILRWSILLGRIDIITKVSFLSSFNVSSREGHLEAAYRVFGYLYSHKRGDRVVFDDDMPEVKEEQFKRVDWKSIYGDITEDIPCNIPESRGNPVMISMFTDAAFAGDFVRRRLQSGILIFINPASITWYSKR